MTWDFDGWFVPEPGMALSIAAEKVAVACGDGKAEAAASFMRQAEHTCDPKHGW